MNLGKNLKKLRLQNGLSLAQLSKQLNIKPDSFSKYETAINTPSVENLIRISKYFQVSVDYLLFGENNEYFHNLLFIKLASKIDKINNHDQKFNIEKSTATLLAKYKISNSIVYLVDNPTIQLSKSFHNNLKILRNQKKYTLKQLGERLNISRELVAMYELKNYPRMEVLGEISKIFNLSIHYLVTGDPLHFAFKDQTFLKTIQLGDHYLSDEDTKAIILLMKAIIQTSSVHV